MARGSGEAHVGNTKHDAISFLRQTNGITTFNAGEMMKSARGRRPVLCVSFPSPRVVFVGSSALKQNSHWPDITHCTLRTNAHAPTFQCTSQKGLPAPRNYNLVSSPRSHYFSDQKRIMHVTFVRKTSHVKNYELVNLK